MQRFNSPLDESAVADDSTNYAATASLIQTADQARLAPDLKWSLSSGLALQVATHPFYVAIVQRRLRFFV